MAGCCGAFGRRAAGGERCTGRRRWRSRSVGSLRELVRARAQRVAAESPQPAGHSHDALQQSDSSGGGGYRPLPPRSPRESDRADRVPSRPPVSKVRHRVHAVRQGRPRLGKRSPDHRDGGGSGRVPGSGRASGGECSGGDSALGAMERLRDRAPAQAGARSVAAGGGGVPSGRVARPAGRAVEPRACVPE